jgi:hypothetical protein
MGIAYNPAIIRSNLVLCLDAANPKSYPGSGTTWTDLSGFGNNGTLINGVGYSSDNLGSFTKMYINAQETVSSTLDSAFSSFSNTTNQPLEISRRGELNSYANVDIPQVSIYNRALTASEIQQNFNATKSRYI